MYIPVVMWCGACVAFAAAIVLERKRMKAQEHFQRMRGRAVPEHEISEDCQEDLLIAPMGLIQRDPLLWQLQAAIEAADDAHVRSLLAGAGTRHPDAMKLDRGLTPLLLAAYIPVRSEEHDRRLRQIMKTLLERGALITQREEFSGATVMHLLASKPLRCSVIHRIRFLLNVLEDHRNAEARVPGLMFDPVLNGAPVDGGTIGGMFSIAVHLLGMRCYQGKLPEEVAPPGRRQTDLRRERRLLPLGLRDTGYEDTSAGFN